MPTLNDTLVLTTKEKATQKNSTKIAFVNDFPAGSDTYKSNALFLKKMATQTGFVHHVPPGSPIMDSSWGWQLRIAIKPTPKNLNKAVQALDPILVAANTEFKCFMLNDGNTREKARIGWDGMTMPLEERSDQNQLGKELCIYIRLNNHTQRFEKTPEEWKQLMLQCWQALAANNVQIGYTAAPYGDKAIETEIGVSPFSYAALKPAQNTNDSETHGILYQDNYNPERYRDPLEGVYFTAQDLAQWNLIGSAKAMVNKRLNHQINHVIAAKQRLIMELQEIETNQTKVTPIITLIAEFKQLIKQADENNQSPLPLRVQEIVRELEARYPRLRHSILEIHPDLKEIICYINNDKDSFDRAHIDKRLDQLAESYPIAIQQIQADYNRHSQITAFCNAHLQQELSTAIENNPVAMQLMHRKLVHLERETNQIKELHPLAVNLNKQQQNDIDAVRKTNRKLLIAGLVCLLPLFPIGVFLLVKYAMLNTKMNKQQQQLERNAAKIAVAETSAIELNSVTDQPTNNRHSLSYIEEYVFPRQPHQGSQVKLMPTWKRVLPKEPSDNAVLMPSTTQGYVK